MTAASFGWTTDSPSPGKMDTVGFLLFLDGQPQPYKVNDTTAEYEYCHSFLRKGRIRAFPSSL